MNVRRFYSPPETFSEDEFVRLGADETRHLKNVLRLEPGESVRVFDGIGGEFECLIESIARSGCLLKISKRICPASPESPLGLTLAVTLLKGEKLDPVIQKAVELGVRALIPITSVRCEVRSKDPLKRVERWRKIATEATKQCGRATLMRIEDLTDFASLMARPAAGIKVLFSERNGGGFSSIENESSVVAFFGPEGGWDDAELKAAIDSGARIVTFGGRIMKADTAAVAITAILQHNFGDMN